MSKSQVIPFESASLPAFLQETFGLTNDLLVSGGGGYPTVSIKGKVFTLKRGDEKTLITDSNDEPARSLEVVILKAGPAGDKLSKVYYASGYTEGSDAKPLCYSNDGIAPGVNATEPQSKSCATCPKNIWGSHVSEDGKKGKACSDSKRLAIAPAGQVNDPMLMRVPAASLKALTAFGQQLAKRGVPYQAVVAKIGFDYSVAHPALTFKPVGFVDESTLMEIKEVVESDLVKRICGEVEDLYVPDDADTAGESFEQKKPEPKVEPKKTVVKPKPQVTEEAPAPTPKPTAKSVVQEVEDDLDAALDDMDFDD